MVSQTGSEKLAEQVAEQIRKVPAGKVITYADIANALGMAGAHRALATHFTAAVRAGDYRQVPYHRLVLAGGRLGAWHDEAFQERLTREGHTFVGTGNNRRIAGFEEKRFRHR